MADHGPRRHAQGTGVVLQGALPKRRGLRQPGMQSANGLLVRGVVSATYVFDEGEGIPSRGGSDEQLAVYADVVVYSGLAGSKFTFLPRCVVSQERSGIHDGDIWIPRATTVDTSGSDLNIQNPRSSDPMDWDGDHVLVGFLDDTLNLPVILRAMPHPQADKGKASTAALGDRVRVTQADGQPRFVKHRGVVQGVDAAGNYQLDTTRANNGVYDAQGLEPAAPEDGTAGNVEIRVQAGATYTLSGPNGQTIRLNPDGSILINAGDDAQPVTIQGSAANVETTTVSLGDGAGEAVVLGTTWNAQRAILNTQLQTLLTTWSAALTTLLGVLQPPTGIPPPNVPSPAVAAYITTVLPLVQTLATAVSTFEGQNYLSANVTTRT